jgi:hypothetical protein
MKDKSFNLGPHSRSEYHNLVVAQNYFSDNCYIAFFLKFHKNARC